jgi:hypothetical protein
MFGKREIEGETKEEQGSTMEGGDGLDGLLLLLFIVQVQLQHNLLQSAITKQNQQTGRAKPKVASKIRKAIAIQFDCEQSPSWRQRREPDGLIWKRGMKPNGVRTALLRGRRSSCMGNAQGAGGFYRRAGAAKGTTTSRRSTVQKSSNRDVVAGWP